MLAGSTFRLPKKWSAPFELHFLPGKLDDQKEETFAYFLATRNDQ